MEFHPILFKRDGRHHHAENDRESGNVLAYPARLPPPARGGGALSKRLLWKPRDLDPELAVPPGALDRTV